MSTAPRGWRTKLLGPDGEAVPRNAPALVVTLAVDWEEDAEGRHKHYYVRESVGIAAGFFIAAVHEAGLATLTHTPSPMGFLAHPRPPGAERFRCRRSGTGPRCEVPKLDRAARPFEPWRRAVSSPRLSGPGAGRPAARGFPGASTPGQPPMAAPFGRPHFLLTGVVSYTAPAFPDHRHISRVPAASGRVGWAGPHHVACGARRE